MFEKVNGVWEYVPSTNISNPVQIFGYGVTSEEGAEKQIKKRSQEIADITAKGKLPSKSQLGILQKYVEGLAKFRGDIADLFPDAYGFEDIGKDDKPTKELKPQWL